MPGVFLSSSGSRFSVRCRRADAITDAALLCPRHHRRGGRSLPLSRFALVANLDYDLHSHHCRNEGASHMGRHPQDHSALPLLRAAFAPARAEGPLGLVPSGVPSSGAATSRSRRLSLGPFCTVAIAGDPIGRDGSIRAPLLATLFIDGAPLELGSRLQEDVASRTAALSLRMGSHHIPSRWVGKARGAPSHIFAFSLPAVVGSAPLHPSAAPFDAQDAWLVLDSSVGCWRASLAVQASRLGSFKT